MPQIGRSLSIGKVKVYAGKGLRGFRPTLKGGFNSIFTFCWEGRVKCEVVQALLMVPASGDTHVKFRVTRDMPSHSNYSLAMNKTGLHLSGAKVEKWSAKCINVRVSVNCVYKCA